MKLIPIIQKINKIKKDISENQTLISTILPIFKYLGWDIFNENRVIFEDVTSTKKRVDLTLVFEDNSKFIVEAKRLSHKLSIKDFEQLTAYINSDESINFGILTNGIDYWIADNKGSGLDEKKIYGFSIFDITECDLNILKLFFSFHPSYKLEDMNRYIDYINIGQYFSQNNCEKVLEIQNFEVEKELDIKKFEEIQVEKSIKKPKFDNEKITNLLVEKDNSVIEEINNIQDTEIQIQSIDFDVEVVKYESDEKIEFFELLERSKAKIFLAGEYHILKDSNFSTLFIQMIKYTLDKIKLYPALFTKIVTEFHFIVERRDGDYKNLELITDGYFFKTDMNNYTKLKNIETLLKFVQENLE